MTSNNINNSAIGPTTKRKMTATPGGLLQLCANGASDNWYVINTSSENLVAEPYNIRDSIMYWFIKHDDGVPKKKEEISEAYIYKNIKS